MILGHILFEGMHRTDRYTGEVPLLRRAVAADDGGLFLVTRDKVLRGRFGGEWKEFELERELDGIYRVEGGIYGLRMNGNAYLMDEHFKITDFFELLPHEQEKLNTDELALLPPMCIYRHGSNILEIRQGIALIRDRNTWATDAFPIEAVGARCFGDTVVLWDGKSVRLTSPDNLEGGEEMFRARSEEEIMDAGIAKGKMFVLTGEKRAGGYSPVRLVVDGESFRFPEDTGLLWATFLSDSIMLGIERFDIGRVPKFEVIGILHDGRNMFTVSEEIPVYGIGDILLGLTLTFEENTKEAQRMFMAMKMEMKNSFPTLNHGIDSFGSTVVFHYVKVESGLHERMYVFRKL